MFSEYFMRMRALDSSSDYRSDCYCAQSSPICQMTAGFCDSLFTSREFVGDEITKALRCKLRGKSMAGGVPMSISYVFAEAMEKYLVGVGMFLHLRSESYHVDVIVVAKVANAIVRIKNILGADAF